MSVKVSATIARKYLEGKEPKEIEDILCKALEAWFAAEGGDAEKAIHCAGRLYQQNLIPHWHTGIWLLSCEQERRVINNGQNMNSL